MLFLIYTLLHNPYAAMKFPSKVSKLPLLLFRVSSDLEFSKKVAGVLVESSGQQNNSFGQLFMYIHQPCLFTFEASICDFTSEFHD